MSLKGISVKKMARDIGEGYILITAASLKKYQPQDLKQLLTVLSIVQREIRTTSVPDDDFDAVKKRNWRLQNISRSMMIINGFIKHRRIKID